MNISVYTRLIRLDKPDAIGLLYMPCLWALLIYTPDVVSLLRYAVIFFIGAVFTRSAGCIINDIADAELDRTVLRTKQRPLASGELSRKQALGFLLILACCTAPLWWLIPVGARYVVPAAVLLTCAYPLAKRYVSMPQIVLAITFNSGVIMAGFTADALFPLLGITTLYAAACVWTFAYDTIYALPDKEADASAGMHSATLALGRYMWTVVYGCYGVFYSLIVGYVIIATDGQHAVYAMLAMSAAVSFFLLLSYQTSNTARRYFFRGNLIAGALIAVAFTFARFN